MEKPELFDTRKSFIGTVLFLLFLILIRLGFEYRTYEEFVSKPFYFAHAAVLQAYEKSKHGKTYTVLKLHADEGFTFYTTSHKKEDFRHKKVRIQIFPDHGISFKDYLGTFYVKSRIKEVKKLPWTVKESLLEKVAAQHAHPAMQSFYNAIFFATPIEKALREKISLLGVSHLVALSGFHLGILYGMIYGLLLLIYRPLQQRRFPYRFALLDLGLVSMVLLGAYLWFVDFPPSLFRSYAMLMVGWVVILMGVELLSFKFLTSIALLLIALFPSLLVSLGFGFSIVGVFYIFLLLQYSKQYGKWMISLLFIPIGIFLLMLPVVHMVFGMTSVYQLLSPILSLFFIPFYPLVMVLHLVGLGNLLDGGLLWLFSLPKESTEHLLPWWLGCGYITVSIVAIWKQKVFYLLLILATLYGAYIFTA